MKQDFSDLRSKTADEDSRSDLMIEFMILSKKTFLLINCYVWVAFVVCFEKLLEEKGTKEFKTISMCPAGSQFDMAYIDIKE